MDLQNKNILITGVGKGIGNQLFKESIANCNFVFGVVRSEKDYKNLSKLKFKNYKLFKGDIKSISVIKKIIHFAKNKKIKINCLVNNAGERQRVPFLKLSKIKIKSIFENNYFSHFFLIQKFINYVVANKITNVSIVNIGSIVGMRGFQSLSGYASTKLALEGLTKSLAVEFANRNIRVNIVNPGFIKTSYFKKFKKNKKKLYNWTLKKIPQKTWGESKDISGLVLFLLSDHSSYITGQSICADGGWTAE